MSFDATQPQPTQNISSGQATILSNFAYLASVTGNSANGYYKMPNGLILNWGSANVANSAAGTTVSFNQAYTTAVYSIITQIQHNTSTGDGGTARTSYVVPGTVSTSSFKIKLVSTSTPEPIYWFAIGK